jgi:hypothetical protein
MWSYISKEEKTIYGCKLPNNTHNCHVIMPLSVAKTKNIYEYNVVPSITNCCLIAVHFKTPETDIVWLHVSKQPICFVEETILIIK